MVMAASFVGFTVYYSRPHAPSTWALPVFTAILVAEALAGLALMWRVRHR